MSCIFILEIFYPLSKNACVYHVIYRYIKRGVDVDGDVANFVETEQIVTSEYGDVISFVQVCIF